jgi:hypothetical protein
MLKSVGARFDAHRDRYLAPEESTVRRLAQLVDGDLLDAAVSAWLCAHTASHASHDHTGADHTGAGHTGAGQAGEDQGAGDPPTAVAIDGKSLRGTYPRTGGTGVQLLAAITLCRSNIHRCR